MQCVDADTLISNLTVFEMLLYTAELKLPRWMSYRDKVCKVATIIQQLALTTCQHVRIGSAVQRGISGERLPSWQEVSAMQNCLCSNSG